MEVCLSIRYSCWRTVENENVFFTFDVVDRGSGVFPKNLMESTRWFVGVVSWWRDERMKLKTKRN